MESYVKKFGCSRPDLAFASFKDRSHAAGATYLDWQAAWRNWCRNHDRFGCPCQSVPATPRPQKYFSAKEQEARYAAQEAKRPLAAPIEERKPLEPIGNLLGGIRPALKA
jgi:hypothetical protein